MLTPGVSLGFSLLLLHMSTHATLCPLYPLPSMRLSNGLLQHSHSCAQQPDRSCTFFRAKPLMQWKFHSVPLQNVKGPALWTYWSFTFICKFLYPEPPLQSIVEAVNNKLSGLLLHTPCWGLRWARRQVPKGSRLGLPSLPIVHVWNQVGAEKHLLRCLHGDLPLSLPGCGVLDHGMLPVELGSHSEILTPAWQYCYGN